MSYHNFKLGNTYSLEHVRSELNRFFEAGQYDDLEGKSEHLQFFEDCDADGAVWTPFAEKGWGASPINRRAWKRTDGSDL